MTTLRIALAQLDPMVGDLPGNVRRIRAAQAQAEAAAAEAAVFSELVVTGYPPEDLLLRSDFLRATVQALAELAASSGEMALIVGFPERDGGALYNSAAVLRRGRIEAVYRKHELPNYGVFDEKRYFTPGDRPCLFDLAGVPVGITLCEDLWQPGIVERTAKAGARLILNLNASPFHVHKTAERESVARARIAVAGVPVLYVNQVGGQDELVFDGASFVIDAHGRVIRRLPEFETALAVAEFRLEAGRLEPLPGEVVPVCDEVTSVYRAIVLGIRDYVTRNGFDGAVLGLSGGIDSAVTLALAVDALGSEQVEAVLMPSRYTAAMSIEDARFEAEALGVVHHLISIEPAFEAFQSMLAATFAGYAPDTTEENIQARCRGVVLMAISNKKRRILLTTGNKSEMSVGYATLYGDMAGGFAPLKDVYKLLVYQLARHRNQRGPVIPERVLVRAPSAELAPDQLDQDTLPPYELLDPILHLYIEEDRAVEEIIAAGYPERHVLRAVSLVDRNEYKRRQAPPGVRITGRAFGRERRYPITSSFGQRLKAP